MATENVINYKLPHRIIKKINIEGQNFDMSQKIISFALYLFVTTNIFYF